MDAGPRALSPPRVQLEVTSRRTVELEFARARSQWQVWGVHDAMPEGMRPAVLLGAFAGLRTSEVVALSAGDVDLMRGIVTPARQYGGAPLKSQASSASIPIPRDLTLSLSAELARTGSEHFVTSPIMRATAPWSLERAVRAARPRVDGLPAAIPVP